MQKSLVQKGYFIILKDFDSKGRNKRNLITTTLPDNVFSDLKTDPKIMKGDHDPYISGKECKRSYLDRTKIFIRINYHLLKYITSCSLLNTSQKILFMSIFAKSYANYMSKDKFKNDNDFSFTCSYKELTSQNFSNIYRDMSKLQQIGFIKTENFYVKKPQSYDDELSNNKNSCKLQDRQDQSLWKVTLYLPKDFALGLHNIKDRSSVTQSISMIMNEEVTELSAYDSLDYSDAISTISGLKQSNSMVLENDFAKFDPTLSKTTPLLIKNNKTNIYR